MSPLRSRGLCITSPAGRRRSGFSRSLGNVPRRVTAATTWQKDELGASSACLRLLTLPRAYPARCARAPFAGRKGQRPLPLTPFPLTLAPLLISPFKEEG